MQIQTSLTLRIIYCLAVLGAVFPFPILPAGASMLLAPKHFGSSCKLEPA